jgi:L-threonylcarbamoyladenylate synthase
MLTQFLQISGESIQKAATAIQEGGLVVYPTDTVYGIGCDPFNDSAVRKLTAVKRRHHGSLPVLVANLGKARELGFINGDAEVLALRFWPGPLTIVVASRVPLPLQVTGPEKTIGLRIPDRKDTLDLISLCGGSLIGTSANISGTQSLTRIEDALKVFKGKVDIMLDGGSLSTSVESTVVRKTETDLKIIREGSITRRDLGRALMSKFESQE